MTVYKQHQRTFIVKETRVTDIIFFMFFSSCGRNLQTQKDPRLSRPQIQLKHLNTLFWFPPLGHPFMCDLIGTSEATLIMQRRNCDPGPCGPPGPRRLKAVTGSRLQVGHYLCLVLGIRMRYRSANFIGLLSVTTT